MVGDHEGTSLALNTGRMVSFRRQEQIQKQEVAGDNEEDKDGGECNPWMRFWKLSWVDW